MMMMVMMIMMVMMMVMMVMMMMMIISIFSQPCAWTQRLKLSKPPAPNESKPCLPWNPTPRI